MKKVGTQETLQRMMRGNLFGFSLTVESVKYADHPDLSQVSGNDGTVPVFRVNELSDYWKTKPEALLRKVPDDEKLMRKVFASGQTRKLMYVTEQGLYRLLFKSTHPDADLFLRWVTYEILPSIRKTGLYCGDVASLAAAMLRCREYLALRGIGGSVEGFGRTVMAVCRRRGLEPRRDKWNKGHRYPVAALDRAAEGKPALRGPLSEESGFRTFVYASKEEAAEGGAE
ncbi:MAG TPA: Bro-N domain-containing protein [Kiritimatiellia bacterium]|nr:Bro-N domain-containing protein [Kiritimatiellia bacterium]